MRPLTRWESALSVTGLAAAIGISFILVVEGGSVLLGAVAAGLVVAVTHMAITRKFDGSADGGRGQAIPQNGPKPTYGVKRTYGLYLACSWLAGASAALFLAGDEPSSERLVVAAAVAAAFMLLLPLAYGVILLRNRWSRDRGSS